MIRSRGVWLVLVLGGFGIAVVGGLVPLALSARDRTGGADRAIPVQHVEHPHADAHARPHAHPRGDA